MLNGRRRSPPSRTPSIHTTVTGSAHRYRRVRCGFGVVTAEHGRDVHLGRLAGAPRKLELAQSAITTQHLRPQGSRLLASVVTSVIPHDVTIAG
jgi:hypothetical protein